MQSLLTLEERWPRFSRARLRSPPRSFPSSGRRQGRRRAGARAGRPSPIRELGDGRLRRPRGRPRRAAGRVPVAAGRPSSRELPAGCRGHIATGARCPRARTLSFLWSSRSRRRLGRIRRAARTEAHIRTPWRRRLGGGRGRCWCSARAGADRRACGGRRRRGPLLRRPRVAVLATGSELRSPGETLEPGQIYESNRG